MLALSLFLILLNIMLSAWWIINGNILFHTDIARDFLLIEDIVVNKNLTLIGPRSGAIPGVFHGPFWLYLNLPSFLIGRGNPVVVGWFWVLLSIISLAIIYFVGKKLFNSKTGLLSALLLSVIQVPAVKSLFNPYGALMLAPVFFYFFVLYLKNEQVKQLILSLFILGLIIQLQMAFGVPILLLSIVYLIYFLIKKRKTAHLLSLSVLAIPLSTYILFDLRHNFLQTRSVIKYLSGAESHGKIDLGFWETVGMRLREMSLEAIGMLTTEQTWLSILIMVVFGILLWHLIQKKKLSITSPYLVFGYFYFGYWVITLLFKGPIWSYYFWPFLPLIILVFCSAENVLHKYLFYTAFILIFLFNFKVAIGEVQNYNLDFLTHGESSWKFNYNVAKSVYESAEENFGYFIFTPDLYGYYPRYAMNYVQKQYPNTKAYAFEKKPITYLLIAPPPSYGKDPNSSWYQKNINAQNWKTSDIKINKSSESTIEYSNGFIVEKYSLSKEEIKVNANPNLINNLIFR